MSRAALGAIPISLFASPSTQLLEKKTRPRVGCGLLPPSMPRRFLLNPPPAPASDHWPFYSPEVRPILREIHLVLPLILFPDPTHQVGTHLAACVLQQIDPLLLTDSVGADPDTAGDEQYTDRGSSRQGTAYSEASRPGPGSSPAEALAKGAPLPMFNKPRCVSGKLPGGLWYVRATLPPAVESSKRREGKGGGGDGGGSSDGEGDGEGDGASDTEEGRRDGGVVGDAAKSFTTGAIVIGGCGTGEEKENGADGEIGVAGDYCLVRVDSLDRVCDVIYCGRGAVEAKNLSKVVGVQLGYLQASGGT